MIEYSIKVKERFSIVCITSISKVANEKTTTATAIPFCAFNDMNIFSFAVKSIPLNEKIIEKYLPEFYNSLRSIHNGERGFFKVSVDVQRNADNQVAQSGENTVKLPLTYTEDEYVRFVTWVTDNMS